ncbi:MAG: STAS domain-containing protein [Desulfatitalea sp.]|nr:STAS domain-containing protein [Desulfatitalea sp.]
MPIETQPIDGRSTVRISGALNIWEAADVWRALLPLLSSPDPLTVDLSTVETCDGAGLQILCQIARAAGAPNADIRIDTPSPAVTAALALAGLHLDRFPNTAKEA